MSIQLKPIRRSQLISPWGIGAIVPFPNDETLMIAGLDMWRYNTIDGFIIKDERLQKRLGVKELRWPPDFREKDSDTVNYNLKIPAVRFPTWYYCSFCGSMKKTGYYTKHPTCDAYQWLDGRKCKPDSRYKRKMIPERFVVVCPDGHIDDFPIAEWLHANSDKPYNPETCHIRRSTGGTSAALTGVRYRCTCGASRSIAPALRPGALEKIGYHCNGSKPWLGIEKDVENPCTREAKELKVLQRGATNVWFADTRSSIYIPIDGNYMDRKIIAVLDQSFNSLMSHRVNGEINRDMINMLAEMYSVDNQELYKAVIRRMNNIEGMPEVEEDMPEDDYRVAEYNMLVKNSGSDAQVFHSINYTINKYHLRIRKFFKSISLVPKLKETRAFIGFTRLEPGTETNILKCKQNLRLGDGDWLPAVEVYGEGIFFEFNKNELDKWAVKSNVNHRIDILRSSYSKSIFNKKNESTLRPEFVLIHTFAHLLINQLSYECGYGSSSIRERIYCEKSSNNHDMYGVLLYTASGDSEGSLGGLVRQGEPGRIENTIVAALENAKWCSSDPICIQSHGQGPESCNLAACHNCALLPETCCENGNRLLDRGFVIGTIDEPSIGYFNTDE